MGTPETCQASCAPGFELQSGPATTTITCVLDGNDAMYSAPTVPNCTGAFAESVVHWVGLADTRHAESLCPALSFTDPLLENGCTGGSWMNGDSCTVTCLDGFNASEVVNYTCILNASGVPNYETMASVAAPTCQSMLPALALSFCGPGYIRTFLIDPLHNRYQRVLGPFAQRLPSKRHLC